MFKINIWMFVVIIFVSSAIFADTVIFKSGKRLECKVVPSDKKSKKIRLIFQDEGSSSLVVPVDSILRIDYDYESRLDSLKNDDFLKHFELGMWCFNKKFFKRSISRFLFCLGRKNIPAEIEFYLAKSFVGINRPKYISAREHYKKYLSMGKDNELKKKCLAELGKVEKIIKEQGLDKSKNNEEDTDEGLEIESWQAPRWGNMSKISHPRIANKKNRVLAVEYSNKSARGKVLTENDRKAPIQLTIGRDTSKTPLICFDVYNPARNSINLAVVVTTGVGYEWFESKMIKIPAKKWTIGVTIDLTKRIWKAKRTKWQYGGMVAGLEKTRALFFLIYNGTKKGKIYFDKIEFKTK